MRLPFAIVITILAGSSAFGDLLATVPPDEGLGWTNYGLHGRIVNGTKAALRQFPHQVSLRRSYNSNHFCGGSLINERYVITAGHCMYMNGGVILPWTIMVVAGDLQLNEQSSIGQRRGVEDLLVHEQFNLSTLQNDVALLTLKSPFKLTPEVNIVTLSTHSPISDTMCQVAGWGYPSEDFPVVSNDLMYVDVPIVERDVCKKLLENVTNLPPGMFCAGYLEGMKDACQGDSGGSMVCNGILTGVVSGGQGCAVPGYPGVYSDVFFYRQWISLKTNLDFESQTFTPAAPAPVQPSGAEKVLPTVLLPFFYLFYLFRI